MSMNVLPAVIQKTKKQIQLNSAHRPVATPTDKHSYRASITLTAGLLLLLIFLFPLAAGARPVITSQKRYFDPAKGLYFLKGDVYVGTNKRVITADEASVDIAGQQVWAKGNIMLKQDGLTFTGDNLYVIGRRTIAEITGNLRFESEDITITADRAEYNWQTRVAALSGNITLTKDGETTTHSTLKYNVKEKRVIDGENQQT